jgi:hypothetical protein
MESKYKKIIISKLFKYKGYDAIAIPNSRLDFEQTYIFLGFTNNGVKLGDIYSEGPEGIKWQKKIAKIRKYSDGLPYLSIGRGTGTGILFLK